MAGLFTDGLNDPTVAPNQGLPTSLTGWSDPRLTQANGDPIPTAGIYQASTLEPSAENTALMAYLDSDPTREGAVGQCAATVPGVTPRRAVTRPRRCGRSTPTTPTSAATAGLIGKELSINAETNAPAELGTWNGLGGSGGGPDDVFPLSSVWAGAPQGTPWNIPTAAIQNAAMKFVAPSETAAAASEADATMDPATHLVTFAPNATDAAAYNNYLMVESYLVVPTSGLTAAKASKLAQYIRFVVGPVAQSDEETLGSAPRHRAMVAADLKVAAQLDTEAATVASDVEPDCDDLDRRRPRRPTVAGGGSSLYARNRQHRELRQSVWRCLDRCAGQHRSGARGRWGPGGLRRSRAKTSAATARREAGS